MKILFKMVYVIMTLGLLASCDSPTKKTGVVQTSTKQPSKIPDNPSQSKPKPESKPKPDKSEPKSESKPEPETTPDKPEPKPEPTPDLEDTFIIDVQGEWDITTTDMTGLCALRPTYTTLTIRATEDIIDVIKFTINNTCIESNNGDYTNTRFIGFNTSYTQLELIEYIYLYGAYDTTVKNMLVTIPDNKTINIVIEHTDKITSVLKITKK